MRIVLSILLLFSIALLAQDAKPKEITLKDLPEVEALRIENVYMRMDTLQAQMQAAQLEYDSIRQDKLPKLIGQIKAAHKWDSYEFDYQTLSFKQRDTKP